MVNEKREQELLNSYIAGIIDARGRFYADIAVNKTASASYSVIVQFSLTGLNDVTDRTIDQWLSENGIFVERTSRGHIKIKDVDKLERLCDLIENYTITLFNDVRLMKTQIIPMLREQKNTTKEGIVEILEPIEKLEGHDENKKYNREFFIEEFDLERPDN